MGRTQHRTGRALAFNTVRDAPSRPAAPNTVRYYGAVAETTTR